MIESDKPTPITKVKQGLSYLIVLAIITYSQFSGVPIHAAEANEILEFPTFHYSVYLDYDPYKEIDLEEAHAESSAVIDEVAETSAPRAAVVEAAETSPDERMEALINATYILETGHGTSILWKTQFNAGGIKCGATYCSYGSEEEGLNALRTLLIRYVDNHGYDLKAIRDIYSESDDTALFTEIYNNELRKIREGV